jgi:hypothetical protein
MSHQGNMNPQTQMTAPSMNSHRGLQNNSTSMNANTNILPSSTPSSVLMTVVIKFLKVLPCSGGFSFPATISVVLVFSGVNSVGIVLSASSYRPSKQTTHTRLENVVNKLYGDRVVSPMEEIASTFPLTEESTSSDQDVLSYNNDITTTLPLSAVQPTTTSQISNEQPALSINSLETPASIESSEISEIQSDGNHVNSSPDMTLCILNTFSLSSSDVKLSLAK